MGCLRERHGRGPGVRSLSGKALLSASITLLALGVAVLPATAARSTKGQAVRLPQQQVAAQATARPQYAIEFRSRYALSYGHTFVTFGRLNERGELINREVAGLHPKGDSSNPWMLGHFIPVISETGPSDGDLEDEYTSARFRVVVDEAEYSRILAYIRYRQTNSGTWHAVFNNCSMWVGDIARYMGLKAPNHLLMPADYINTMRRINEGNSRASAQSLRATEASAR